MAVDVVKIIVVGMAIWLVAFLVLLLAFREQLEAHHTTYWLWTCLTGIGLGIVGMPYALRVARREVAEHAQATKERAPDTAPNKDR
jgi:hypothetical protein